ncbi:MAG: monooxygenase [Candidimonas sp.]|nr:MAG: monooxygenase [Candidimonas sp.]
MKSDDYDIAIRGAGPTGTALALLLARYAPDPARIALIGRPPADGVDPRSLALNQGSRMLLEQLEAWPTRAADVRTVHVSQRHYFGRTLIRCEDLGVPRLGCVVAYAALLDALRRAAAHSGVTLIESSRATATSGRNVQIALDEQVLSSRVAVLSDGARPRGLHREYGQHAVVATVEVGQPRPGWAFERFTDEGPLAMLPHPDEGGLYSMVWCCAPDHARELANLSSTAFATALRAAFGDRLGQFGLKGERHIFPLSLHAGPSLPDPDIVAIGNAAQTLHPVAGQGLNLGLRDAAQLAQALSPWLAHPSTTPTQILAAFARRRRADRYLTAGITDFLPRVFATHNPLPRHTRGLCLLALDLSRTLRAPLARHLMQGLRI